MDVAFSVVPFGPVLTPSLGASILKSSLTDNNIDSRIFYGSFDFADFIGLSSYLTILESPAGLLVGEFLKLHGTLLLMRSALINCTTSNLMIALTIIRDPAPPHRKEGELVASITDRFCT